MTTLVFPEVPLSLRIGFHWLRLGQVPIAEPITMARGGNMQIGEAGALCSPSEAGMRVLPLDYGDRDWWLLRKSRRRRGEWIACLPLGSPGLKGVK